MILGIVGDSAAGKSTLTQGIAAILGPDRVACICSDDYHRYSRAERGRMQLTALHPACNHLDILEQHLRLLRQGQPIPQQSDPAVASELMRSDIVDDHRATAVVRVQYGDDPVDAHCSVRAIAEDKTIVGETSFAPDAPGDYDVTIATERRATAVENVGCTASDQPRPR